MDYRYFPEPDLPPLRLSVEEIEAVRAGLPELPRARKARFQASHGLTAYEAEMLLQTRAFGDFFEVVAVASGSGKQAANWMLGEVSRILNDRGGAVDALGISPSQLGDLIRLVEGGTINLNTAKEVVFPALLAGEGAPGEIVARKGLGQVHDREAIAGLVRGILEANPQQLEQFHAGKTSLRGFFIGQAMKAGGGRINPQILNAVLDEALASEEAP